jgi:hypothetical protein
LVRAPETVDTFPINTDPIRGIGDGITSVDIPPSTVAEEPAVAEEPKEEITVTGGTTVPGVVVSGVGGTVADFITPDPLPVTTEELPPVEEPKEEITVTGGTTVPGEVVSGIGGVVGNVSPIAPSTPVEEPVITEETPPVEEPKEEITVTGGTTVPGVVVSGVGGTVTDFITPDKPPITTEETPPAEEPKEEITVTGGTTVPGEVVSGIGGVVGNVSPLTPSEPVTKDDDSILDTIKDVADVVTTVLPVVGGVGGGGGGGGTRPPDTTGLTFTKTTLRPTIPAGGIGGTGGRYPYTPQTYGRRGGDQETEYLFFTRDPITGQATIQSAPAVSVVNPATVPVKKEGGEINDDMVKHLVDYHKNGGHQGPGQVKGIGSGQEDKIPAYLSDGEYVWSAQDVADLGDGSTDEGVRRLDKMRKMVRQQAGRKDVKKIAKPQKGIDRMLKAVGGMA